MVGRLVDFSTLPLHKDRASDIDGVVTMETGARTLLISLYSILPTLYYFLSWQAPHHLPHPIASLDQPSLLLRVFLFVFSPFYPVFHVLLCQALTELLCPRTTWVYLSPPLQTSPPYTVDLPQPTQIPGLSLHMKHRLRFI